LKPAQSKGTKAGGNEKEKNTKATDGDKKSWKVRFAELEVKMVAMSATTNSGGPKPHDTPSFHVGGGSLPDDEDFERFMLSRMAITAADLTLEAFAYGVKRQPLRRLHVVQVPVLIHSVVRAISKLGYQSHLLWERWSNFFHGSSHQVESSLNKNCTRWCRTGGGSRSGE
jgi:hypothetical protein